MHRTVRKLLKLSVLLLLLTISAVAGYFVPLRYLGGAESQEKEFLAVDEKETVSEEETKRLEETVRESFLTGELPREDLVNLIYCQEESGKFSALVLEVWTFTQKRLSYITIPADTGFTISAELYRMLRVEEPEIPQMMRLSNLYRYYEDERAFDLGIPVMEELLDAEIDSFVVLGADKFGKQFKQTKKGIWKLTKKAEKKLFAAEPEIDTEFYLLPGQDRNAGYEVDRSRMREKFMDIWKSKKVRAESE